MLYAGGTSRKKARRKVNYLTNETIQAGEDSVDLRQVLSKRPEFLSYSQRCTVLRFTAGAMWFYPFDRLRLRSP